MKVHIVAVVGALALCAACALAAAIIALDGFDDPNVWEDDHGEEE